jgi:YggT family protein
MISQVVNIVIYLILVLFLVDLTKSDSYNKVARVIKIILYPILLIFNIYYKKINIGLLIAAVVIYYIYAFLMLPDLGFLGLLNLAIFKISMSLIGILKFVIIAGVILSWVYMFGMYINNSFTVLIQQLYESTVSVFRSIIPPSAGFDLSPLIAFFVLQLSERALNVLLLEILPRISLAYFNF